MASLIILILCISIGVGLFRSACRSPRAIFHNATYISRNHNKNREATVRNLKSTLARLEAEKAQKEAILRRLKSGESHSEKTTKTVNALPVGAIPCRKCGSALEENMRFCLSCGEPVASTNHTAATCSSCGTTLTGYKRFCPECGKPVAAAANTH